MGKINSKLSKSSIRNSLRRKKKDKKATVEDEKIQSTSEQQDSKEICFRFLLFYLSK